MTAILEAPYPQPYHANAFTVFFAARMAGSGLTAAYAVQGVGALAAIGATIWLWRPGRMASPGEKAVLTGVLTLLATPYGYTYDGIAVAINRGGHRHELPDRYTPCPRIQRDAFVYDRAKGLGPSGISE